MKQAGNTLSLQPGRSGTGQLKIIRRAGFQRGGDRRSQPVEILDLILVQVLIRRKINL